MSVQPLFPPASDRRAWRRALKLEHNQVFSAWFTKKAEKIAREPIPELTAALYMEYNLAASRVAYETPYFKRRFNLEMLILAESAEFKGRFMGPIIEYLWSIAGEPVWCLPAHNQNPYDPLPDPSEHFVDLFAAATGMLLAQTLNLLESELYQISPSLVSMLRNAMLRRVIEPLEVEPFPFWWGCGRNNWTPWCCSNCLGTALTVLQDDPPRLKKLIDTLSAPIQRFYEKYPEDGGCDEGPGYWNVSPCVFLVFLEQLPEESPIFAEPKFRRMGEYITDASFGNDSFAAFADANPRTGIAASLAWRYGERCKSAKLRDFAMEALHGFKRGPIRIQEDLHSALFRSLAFIFWLPKKFYYPADPQPSTVWYPDTQLLFAKNRRFALAAKGGHNAENHNHNDVGEFIIMHQGKPIIIDPGVKQYDRFTFSGRRYESWVINAEGHNVPQFNDIMQQHGREYCADKVSRQGDSLSMDIAKAYPKQAGVKKCLRQIEFSDREITIHDRWQLTADSNTVKIPLYTPAPVLKTPGGLFIGKVRLNLAPEVKIKLETVDLSDDPKLSYSWGKSLNKIILTIHSGKKGEIKLTFKEQ